MQSATLRFRHGGLFKTPKNGLVYLGGECKTFEVDPDELCWWWIEKLAKKCGGYKKICEVHYLLPGLSLEEGLRRVYDDNEVREMTTVLVKKGFVDDPDLLPSALEYHTIVEVSVDVEGCSQRRAKKFTPKRAPNKEAKGGRKRAKEVICGPPTPESVFNLSPIPEEPPFTSYNNKPNDPTLPQNIILPEAKNNTPPITSPTQSKNTQPSSSLAQTNNNPPASTVAQTINTPPASNAAHTNITPPDYFLAQTNNNPPLSSPAQTNKTPLRNRSGARCKNVPEDYEVEPDSDFEAGNGGGLGATNPNYEDGEQLETQQL
ncbi:hypothetical protein BVRB_2g036860 [Beta vulgaris subsp. vulgaris]|uniref:PB1-like domain-containing protein n=1 Tax=Beta vulgaris subsp. vulgaris TaxID=3555 RepID=A0A0J8D0E0_BETVV|nr:hypothetical protein BVRB_2g036860 [Beta vulgaris subsp. vulgaris]